MTITTILAIYGAVISTILLFYRIAERREQKRNFLVFLDKYYSPYGDQYNYHSGRKGDQFLRIRITNKSFKENSVAEVNYVTFNYKFVRFFNKRKEFTFNFKFEGKVHLPIKLGYTEQITIYTPLNMMSMEFYQSWDSNIESLQKTNDKFVQAVIVDTQRKKHYSNSIPIKQLIDKFLQQEQTITTEQYRQSNYRKL